MPKVTFYNTLTKSDETFQPISEDRIAIYTCGPTVYDYLHVGNWAAYIYWDTLVRLLAKRGYNVERVMNITDVGHLTSDADEGEDKLEKGARREGKTAWEVAEFYTKSFFEGMKQLGLIEPNHITKATDFIPQQLELVRALKDKGYTYQISDGIYFDTSKFESYGDFAGLDLESLKAGARVEYNAEKRNPSDFALWKFTPTGEKRDMEWTTPVDLLQEGASESESHPGSLSSADLPPLERQRTAREAEEMSTRNGETVMGFPGWHLECSAMALSVLGETIDIHTGGIDHIPVHHTNEIAQSEAATGKRFSNFWLHNNHIKAEGTKISKSLGNGYTLSDLEEKGFSPIDYRMFVLQSHYRSEANFTFENLEAAKNRLNNWRNIAALRHQTHATTAGSQADKHSDDTQPAYATASMVEEALANNLGTPQAMHIVDEAFNAVTRTPLNRINRHALINLLEAIDQLLGLKLIESTPDLPDEAKQLLLERQRARENQDWQASDEIRDKLAAFGVTVRDTPNGAIWEYSK